MEKIQSVRDFLRPMGLTVREFDNPTPTAEAAAREVGCTPGQIAKSILLQVGSTPVLVVTSGDTRVRNPLLKAVSGLSGKVILPAAETLESLTGCPPGGVCPFLLPGQLRVFLDRSLQRFTTVYPAAGTAHSAVAVPVARLAELTGGTWGDVCRLRDEPDGV
jgi:prolyl-tRNA editing enzyme YbaK/EbsC (Cys-tRNA(Pro) deacylase)